MLDEKEYYATPTVLEIRFIAARTREDDWHFPDDDRETSLPWCVDQEFNSLLCYILQVLYSA